MAGKTVVILGGGVGGLVTANELRKRLSREHRVVLVDKEGRHIFWPSLLWLQIGLREPKSITRDLSRLERKGIEVVKGGGGGGGERREGGGGGDKHPPRAPPGGEEKGRGGGGGGGGARAPGAGSGGGNSPPPAP